MRVTFAAIALAAVAIAKPQQLPGLAVMTPEQAGEYCGTGLTLHCCNKAGIPKVQGTTTTKPGLLSGVVSTLLGSDGGSLLGDCSPIEVGGIPGGGALLNGQCRAKVACCNRSQAVSVGGLVNIALPCIALGSLVG